jgi:hypothetical protein
MSGGHVARPEQMNLRELEPRSRREGIVGVADHDFPKPARRALVVVSPLGPRSLVEETLGLAPAAPPREEGDDPDEEKRVP